MFYSVWSLRTLFEMACTIMPILFLRSTFGITNNDNTNTEDDRAQEERRGWRKMSTTHDNQQKANWERHLLWSNLNDRKKTWMMNEMAIRT
jgi:hypothetical protein